LFCQKNPQCVSLAGFLIVRCSTEDKHENNNQNNGADADIHEVSLIFMMGFGNRYHSPVAASANW
jgi:hypothetical protein